MTERLKAVILDWAGTLIDHGSRAPMGAFVRAFAAFDVAITITDARASMGLAKWDHIWALGTAPHVAAAWRAAHGRDFTAADADAIFAVFEPLNVDSARAHADIIPGAVDSLAYLRARGLRVATTTGYTRPIMDVVLPLAEAGGITPEFVVCAGDLPAGRPSPLMMWHAMARLGVWPAWTVVKAGDTLADIGEGVAAGTWTVGVTLSGNMAGLSAAELAALPAADRDDLHARAGASMRAAGADETIRSIAELPAAIDAIAERLAAGHRPGR